MHFCRERRRARSVTRSLLAALLFTAILADAQQITPKPSVPPPASVSSSVAAKADCDESQAKDEFQAVQIEAQSEISAGQWDKAAQLYRDAAKSCSATVRATALSRYSESISRTNTWWWRLGALFPPLRWWHNFPRPLLEISLVLFAILLVVAISPKFLPQGRGLVSWMGTLLELVLMPRFRGRAHIMDSSKLTPSSEADLFANALQNAAREVADRLAHAGGTLQAGTVTLLSLPSAVASQTINSLPEVKGVDLGRLAKLALMVVRYFGWRVESEVAFRPLLKAEDGHPAFPARLRASASLRWAWFTKDSWQVERRVWDQFDVDSVAFAIAARILGKAFDE